MKQFETIEISDSGDPILNKIKSLYFSSFPEDERRPWDNIIFLIENNSPFFHLNAFINCKDEFLGFISYWNLPATKYIEHFAIEPSLRSEGIGSVALTDFVSAVAPQPVVLEVELPESSPEAERRIAFYERNGFSAMSDFPYFQPPYRPNLQMVPMMLMTTAPIPDPMAFVMILHTLVYNQ